MTTQIGWASCPKCQGLHFSGFPGKGVCPAGGQHEQTNSFAYTMTFDVPPTDHVQTGWASCPKCQGMHFAGFPKKGVCPAGGQHAEDNSFAYALTHDVPGGPGAQSEWRSCPKCQGLFFGPFGGTCPTGGQHSADNSFNYLVAFVANPTITLKPVADQDGRFIEVDGIGFTPGQPVKLSYDIFTGGGPNTHAFGEETTMSGATGSFVQRLRVSLGDISGAQVQATDIASGATASASL